MESTYVTLSDQIASTSITTTTSSSPTVFIDDLIIPYYTKAIKRVNEYSTKCLFDGEGYQNALDGVSFILTDDSSQFKVTKKWNTYFSSSPEKKTL